VVGTTLGVKATTLYLIVYLLMNLAAFAVIIARERETSFGDGMQAVAGLGRERPWLAWPLTLSMLGLAGIPATAGFVGKFYLIDAAVSGNYTWLGVVIVIGSMISLGYYLPVIAAMWMRDAPEAEPSAIAAPVGQGPLPAIAGGSPELDELPASSTETPASQTHPEVIAVAVIMGAATLFFGIVPQPLFDLVRHVGRSFGLL
jgi:NADH-quinone oxidoreductase subunit N